MTDLNYIAGAVAGLSLTLVFLGYVRVAIAANQGRLAHHFGLFIICLSAAYVLRATWWDGLHVLIGADARAWLADSTGGISMNILFNGMALIGGYHGLKALHLMIPERDRAEWSWLTAWAYPSWCVSGRLRQFLQACFRRF